MDRRLHRVQRFVWLYRRGSREPCGSKAVFWATACQIGAVEARESLVDRRLIWMQFPLAGTSRGSREPCGSKDLPQCFHVTNFVSRLARALWIEGWSSVVTVIFNRVEARESLVDRRLPNSPLYQCDYRRGSREPCGSKVMETQSETPDSGSRLARALWIEGKDGRPNRPCMHVEARESLVDRRHLNY